MRRRAAHTELRGRTTLRPSWIAWVVVAAMACVVAACGSDDGGGDGGGGEGGVPAGPGARRGGGVRLVGLLARGDLPPAALAA